MKTGSLIENMYFSKSYCFIGVILTSDNKGFLIDILNRKFLFRIGGLPIDPDDWYYTKNDQKC